MCLKRSIAGGLFTATLALAQAQEPAPARTMRANADIAQSQARPAAAQVDAAPKRAVEGFGTAADTERLEVSRGGADEVPQARLQGVVGSNSATGVATGNNVIQSGSFANMSGLPVVIQNSGANVLIQNATVINLEMK